MIEFIIIVLYSLLVMKKKFTPVLSMLTWINRNILIPFLKNIVGPLLKKISKKKTSPFVDVEDPFTYEPPAKKPPTKAQKNVDKAGDEISKLIVEIGKVFTNVDKRIKYFFIGVLNVFFVTGAIYHIRWAFEYWKVSLVLIALFIEWITWINSNKKINKEPIKN